MKTGISALQVRRRRLDSFKRHENSCVVYEEMLVISKDGNDIADVIADLNNLQALLEKVLHSVLSRTTELGETIFADVLVSQAGELVISRLYDEITKSTDNTLSIKLIPYLKLDFQVTYPEVMTNSGFLKVSVGPVYDLNLEDLVSRINNIITEFGFC